MWFQRVSSVDVGDRCLYGAFPMHALAGCKLLSGCLKCCGTSSVKWRVYWLVQCWHCSLPEVLFFLGSLSLCFFSWTSWSAVLPWLFGTATSYSSSISWLQQGWTYSFCICLLQCRSALGWSWNSIPMDPPFQCLPFWQLQSPWLVGNSHVWQIQSQVWMEDGKYELNH